MAHSTQEPAHVGMAIHELILEAHDDGKKDRRSDVRYPFFRPVSIHMGRKNCSAFSREISASGIGLLHDFELTPGEIEVAVPSKKGHVVCIRTRLIWCRPCGEGWYISGGQFLGISRVGG